MSFFASNHYFNPRQVGNLILWLDATDPSANGVNPSDGTSLANWVDKSAAGNTVSQSTGGNKPVFNTNQQNGLPGITFNGSTSYMQAATISSIGNTVTAYGVGLVNNSVGNFKGTFFEYSNGSSSNTGCILFWENTMQFRVVDASLNAYSATFAQSRPFTEIMSGYSDGSTVNIFKFTTLENSTASANMNAGNKLTIGNLVALIGAYAYSGYINSIIICNTALSSDKRSLLLNYLGNKWGISS